MATTLQQLQVQKCQIKYKKNYLNGKQERYLISFQFINSYNTYENNLLNFLIFSFEP